MLMIAQTTERLTRNIQKVIVGKEEPISLLLAAVLCEGHVLLEDVPGTGKTTLARALAASLGCSFRRIQFTPDLLPSDVTGLSWFNQKTQEFEFRPGPIMAQVILADEINRATPRTQSAMLEAMQERQVTGEGVTRLLPRPFLVLATQNPVELEGTFPLPEAQLDRFLLKVRIDYPSAQEEGAMVRRVTQGQVGDRLNVEAVSTLVMLDTHFLTSRSNTFTIYVSLIDRKDPQASIRSATSGGRSASHPRRFCLEMPKRRGRIKPR